MVALLFPGQGAQHVGMGRDLAGEFDVARETFEEADDVLDLPLSRIAWDGPADALTATHNAQPAILTHSIAAHRVVREALGDVGFAAGHSLGEFSAYVAAGAISFADAVRTVRRRGELMHASGEERPGTMAAVLGLDDAGVRGLCERASDAGGDCVPANFNSPGQVVISGDVAAVERAVEFAPEAGARRAVRLKVSGAFHSPLMRSARDGLARHLEGVRIGEPAFPVVANVTAEPVRDPALARRLLVEQLTSPVRWAESMRAILDAGITRFLELGPGTVLGGLMRRIERAAEVTGVGTAEDARAMLSG